MDVGGKRIFEALSEYAYPSKPDRALSTVFLDKMSALTSRNIDNFPVAVAQVVIAMWQQCVDEQFVHLKPYALFIYGFANLIYGSGNQYVYFWT